MIRQQSTTPILILVALLFIGSSADAVLAQENAKEKPAPPAMKWEYKVMNVEDNPAETNRVLNKLGEDGWELVGITPGRSRFSGTADRMILICKRPKTAVPPPPPAR